MAELLAKAPQCPSDIKWHFIGHLQSNKAAKLAAVCILLIPATAIPTSHHHFIVLSQSTLSSICALLPHFPCFPSSLLSASPPHPFSLSLSLSVFFQLPNLYQVECIDSFRLASKLSRACENAGRKNKLRVLIQVNTSGEQSKSGCAPSDCVNLVTEVHQNCKSLQVVGLMTIGAYEAEPSSSFFDVLNQCKSEVFQAIPELKSDDFEMSMGMSHDYDLAIACGRYGDDDMIKMMIIMMAVIAYDVLLYIVSS